MKFKITPEAAVRSVKIWMQVIVCWPPPLNATRKRLILHNITWCVAASLPVLNIPAAIMHSWLGPKDAATLTKNLCELLAMIITLIKMIISKSQQSRLQVAFADLEIFLKTAGPREKAMLDRYMDRCGRFYACVEVMCFITATAFSCGPIVLPQPLPGQADYPFEWRDSPTLYAMLYFTHVVVAAQIAAGAVVDIQMALLLWLSGIKFELLAEDFENAHSPEKLRECVAKHQKLIAHVNDITVTVRYFAVDVLINTGITNICAGYQFVSHQPIEIVLQFFLLFCVTSLEIAMYAWPADNLLAVSENIAQAAYFGPWVGNSQKIQDGTQFVIVRSQKPMVIAVTGILPKLNLDFYGKFLTTSISYFTTLRAVVG